MDRPHNTIATRYQHYRELLDLWEDGLEIIRGFRYHSNTDKERMVKMEAAITLLRTQVDMVAGFDVDVYSDCLYRLKRRIDEIPEATQLEGYEYT